MKNRKRVVAALLAMMFSLSACTGPVQQGTEAPSSEPHSEPYSEQETQDPWANVQPENLIYDDGIVEPVIIEDTKGQEYTFVNDFSVPISTEDTVWYTNDVSDFTGGVLTSAPSTHFLVSPKTKVNAEVSYIEADIRSAIGNGCSWVTGFIGLRCINYSDNAVANGGIWLAFKNDTVGFLTGTWPNVEYMTIPFDFRDFRRVYLEDNMTDNVIRISVANDAGEAVYVGKITIENNNVITMFDAAGEKKGSTVLGYDLASSGYVNFWSHLNDGVTYDNVRVAWTEKVEGAYVGADPSGLTDLYSDTWTATDDVGRVIENTADNAEVEDKLVGMFYQIWHTSTKTFYEDAILYDHSALYRTGGSEAVFDAVGKGPIGWGHYWGEPYFGYYLSTDKWVIRKHAQMLVDIGVDFIYLDVTNGSPFTAVYETIFKVYEEMRQEGDKTPTITFFLGTNAEANLTVFNDIYQNIYSTGRYSDLYTMYKGGILLLGNTEKIPRKRLKDFTVRDCWALKENVKNGVDIWTWMCETPQVASTDSESGETEEISISAGILANTSMGRSWTRLSGEPALGVLPDGSIDYFHFNLPDTKLGILFAEQMERAKSVDPYVLLVTGWNEWTAGRWETTASGALIAGTYQTCSGEDWTKSYYVDCFNSEFSRDIEPMAGDLNDNYYYQLAQFLRDFRGARSTQAAAGQTAIDITAGTEQWSGVWPEYRDSGYDTYHRANPGYLNQFYYQNDSGRNDILSAKVSLHGEEAYFYVACADTITQPEEGSNWMNLYINADGSNATGWYGYDFVLCRSQEGLANGKGTVSVEAFVNNTWEFRSVGTADAVLSGNTLQIQVKKSLVGIGDSFDFKWADNSTSTGDIMQFLDLGDAAPNARFNYHYTTQGGVTVLTEDMKNATAAGIALQVGKAYIAANGTIGMLDSTNTNAVPLKSHSRIFVPAQALAAVEGMQVQASEDGKSVTLTYGIYTLTFTEGSTTVPYAIHTLSIPVAPFVENGSLYIPLNVVAAYFDFQYAESADGCVLMSKTEISAPAALLTEISKKL